jgi:hypothetical protein
LLKYTHLFHDYLLLSLAMVAQVPTGFWVEPSPSVREALHANGLTIDSDRLALDAMADHFKAALPEQPRVVLLHGDELVHTPDVTILQLGPEETGGGLYGLHAPTIRPEDYVVRLPRGAVPETSVVSAGLARIFQRGRRAHNNVTMFRWGSGLIAAGVGESGVAYIGMHSNTWSRVGFGVAAAGMGLITYATNRDKYGKQPKISHLEPPIRITPKAFQRDAIEGATE